jgi:beta-phosphoglucomutase-like phosphatase (HAD superfamily)
VNDCKPDPEGYNKALEQLNYVLNTEIQPNECVVFEDSVAGIEAAKAADMYCIAVTNSYPAEQLSAADLIITTLEGFRF